MRRNIKNANRIVVKVGTSTITHENGKINLIKLDKMVRELADLMNQGKEIILVSSGAVGVGMGKLKMENRPTEITEKQAVASVGQCALMHIYSKLFSEYGIVVGQILLTKNVINDQTTCKNVVNTFNNLLKYNVIPIVNENDAVSTDELEDRENVSFGDNDMLSALVTTITDSDLLIILSDIDGLFDKDPKNSSDAKIIKVVKEIDSKISDFASGAGTKLGTGGMATKLVAAKVVMNSNKNLIITNGSDARNISRILEGKEVGTLFLGEK